MRIMEINEQIVEENNDKKPFPIELAIEMRQEIDDHMKELSNALNKMDLTKAKEILARLQYFNNINDKLIELEVKHGII
jgi:molecular chaperone HscB